MGFDPIAYINEPRWQESRLGLGRIRELLERMGRPQDRLRFVHVAGTNGKGSVCAYLASVLQAAGHRTGLFTSPYIIEFEERIRVDGVNIPRDDLREVTLFVREHAEAMAAETGEHPTEFELMTAVAFEHFAQRGCDIVVCEVGLGGRLDSTNVIEAPEVCVVTRIGLDHTALLGSTVAEVAREKAGIIKRGVPVVSWPQEPEAMRVIEGAAAASGCELVVPSRLPSGVVCFPEIPRFAQSGDPGASASGDPGASASGDSGAGPLPSSRAEQRSRRVEGSPRSGRADAGIVRTFSYEGREFRTRLLGSYQPANAVLAIEASRVLRARGWNVPDEAVERGVAEARWPGRFEVVASGSQTVVVDGGHNPQGAEALADSMRDVFPGRRVVFVMGVLADKDYRAMIREVAPLASAFVCVTPPNPRALPADELATAIREEAEAGVVVVASDGFPTAIEEARQIAGPDGVICAFGSLYSIAEIEAALQALQALQAPS